MNTTPFEDMLRQKDHKKLASMIEHTVLGDGIDEEKITAHVKEALELDVLGICVPLAFVPLAKKLLKGTKKIVITVIDFPYGQKSTEEKVIEAIAAQKLLADEIDLVLDYQALINKNYRKALEDLTAVVSHVAPLPVKVIVETSALTHEQLAIACALVALSEARFIKTSTGFHKSGAQVADISLMRALLPDTVLIKASGGIKDFSSALALVNAGASRIGTSKSRSILEGHSSA